VLTTNIRPTILSARRCWEISLRRGSHSSAGPAKSSRLIASNRRGGFDLPQFGSGPVDLCFSRMKEGVKS